MVLDDPREAWGSIHHFAATLGTESEYDFGENLTCLEADSLEAGDVRLSHWGPIHGVQRIIPYL